jgi:hypothetical protein
MRVGVSSFFSGTGKRTLTSGAAVWELGGSVPRDVRCVLPQGQGIVRRTPAAGQKVSFTTVGFEVA